MRGERYFGMWDQVVRGLAEYNVERFDVILAWPLRDVLLAYEHLLRQEALTDYRLSVLAYAVLAPWSKDMKPPKLPPLLRGH